ncbi:MAG: B12-binding domain-containing protein [Syntrophothermus sp.]
MDKLLEKIAYCVERGKINVISPFPPDLKGEEGVDELTKKALQMNISPELILNDGFIKGMEKVGIKFRDKKIFVPDVLIAAKAMATGMNHLKPLFLEQNIQMKGKVVLGTVAGDLHDIGKNILSMMLQGGGWEIIDLGINVSPQKFVDAIKLHNPFAVGLSALLTTTMVNMKPTIDEIRKANPEIKIMVGGAPITKDFANQIGADFYSPHPMEALDYLNKKLSN